jgi:predicted transcriptional regulator
MLEQAKGVKKHLPYRNRIMIYRDMLEVAKAGSSRVLIGVKTATGFYTTIEFVDHMAKSGLLEKGSDGWYYTTANGFEYIRLVGRILELEQSVIAPIQQ